MVAMPEIDGEKRIEEAFAMGPGARMRKLIRIVHRLASWAGPLVADAWFESRVLG